MDGVNINSMSTRGTWTLRGNRGGTGGPPAQLGKLRLQRPSGSGGFHPAEQEAAWAPTAEGHTGVSWGSSCPSRQPPLPWTVQDPPAHDRQDTRRHQLPWHRCLAGGPSLCNEARGRVGAVKPTTRRLEPAGSAPLGLSWDSHESH